MITEATRPALELKLPELIQKPDGEIDRSFRPYAETGEHLEWLKRFLAEGYIQFRRGMTILELASGGGHSARIIWDAIPDDIKPTVRFIVSDSDRDTLDEAGDRLNTIPNVEFVPKSALDTVEEFEGKADLIFFLNGIHLDSDRKKVLVRVREILSEDEDARLLLNSTFVSTEESIPPNEEKFYKKWMVAQRRLLKDKYPELYWFLKKKANFEEYPVSYYDQLIDESGFAPITIKGFEFDSPNAQMLVSFDGYARVVQYEYWGDMYHVTTDENIPSDWKKVLWDILTEANRQSLIVAWLEVFGPDKKVTPRNNMIRLCRKK